MHEVFVFVVTLNIKNYSEYSNEYLDISTLKTLILQFILILLIFCYCSFVLKWMNHRIVSIMNTIFALRGIAMLKAASKERADGLLQYLNNRQFVYVHYSCRQKYNNEKYIKAYLNKEITTSAYSPLEETLITYVNWLRMERIGVFSIKKKWIRQRKKKVKNQ